MRLFSRKQADIAIQGRPGPRPTLDDLNRPPLQPAPETSTNSDVQIYRSQAVVAVPERSDRRSAEMEVDDQFSEIMTLIGQDEYEDRGDDCSIFVSECSSQEDVSTPSNTKGLFHVRRTSENHKKKKQKVTIWMKVSHYQNSRLPHSLPRLQVYITTWPLICLAAQASSNAYKSGQSTGTTPSCATDQAPIFVSAQSRTGNKAMVLDSAYHDDKKVMVFAIRGTSLLSLRDWNTNLHTAPVSPQGFLDDEGNLCHSGFLNVAKSMVMPIAMSLRRLLEENPSRASCSLLITGHSAGGAVAALLYAHMLSSIQSELSILAECFKRVHCITFGAPPVSLLPLTTPSIPRHSKSLFFSFINEGDPVSRAEKSYMRSLVDLLSSPLPSIKEPRTLNTKRSMQKLSASISRLDLSRSKLDVSYSGDSLQPPSFDGLTPAQTQQRLSPVPLNSEYTAPTWRIPEAVLSNAGRLVVMRIPQQQPHSSRHYTSQQWEAQNLNEVAAYTCTDEQLRPVIFGDPAMHAMKTYADRVDMLALKAVTGRC